MSLELHERERPIQAATVIPPEALAQIQSLYDRGLMLQAWEAAKPFGPLHNWAGAAAITMAGRLASNLGSPRLGTVLHRRAWRADRQNPDLAAYHAYTLLLHHGPLAAWTFLEKCGEPQSEADPDGKLHFFTARAMVAADLRDFAAAESWLKRATESGREHPWLHTAQAHLFESQDRYPEALDAARTSLALRPWYRPGVQAMAHTLLLLDRDNEALAFLSEASRHLENLHVTRQLAALQIDLRTHDAAAASLERFELEAPLLDSHERGWLDRQRVTVACLRNDLTGALEAARKVDDPYYRDLAKRLESGATQRQVHLDVPFVRQHHLTCAPATLSALSRFWNQTAEHLEVAEAICYDGTPGHSERHWAETHGWHAREFTVTWASAVALLDRGVPFTLTTSEATSGHLQAVVGYDEIRQTLTIRDPFYYCTVEFAIDPLLERNRATGPRGMVLVPASRLELLVGLDLADAELYDRLHEVQRALAQHHRAEAVQVCETMQATAPSHRLTLTARRALASYDGNMPALLQCLDELLLQFPNDGNLNLSKLGCLRELARRDERMRLLERLIPERGIDPIFWQQYAHELRADARLQPAAMTWMRWALRYRPTDPDLISGWGDLLWDQRELATACRYYRLAACLGDKREHYARSYFIASRHLRETDTALEFLRQRDERHGARSSSPTVTLVESLQHLGRATEAFAALDAALARRPDDGALQLFAADFNGRSARFEAAARWLREAQANTSPVAWHRSAAALADYQNDRATALQHWREVLALEPLAHDAIRSVALLLAETEGRETALRFLNELSERFPFSCPLLVLRIDWLKSDGADAVIPAVRRLLEINPADAWGWRELALQLEAAGPHSEALAAADEAVRLEPHQPHGLCVRADLLLRHGQTEAARADLREALRLEVDSVFAVHHYVATASTLAQRKEALAEVASELRQQVIFQDALLAYQDAARGVLSDSEVLDLLREAHAVRPDLWQSWSVLIQQLTDMGQPTEALKVAGDAAERFPLLPRLWVDLARVEQSRLNVAGQIKALEKALELSPAYAVASRLLAAIYERDNNLAGAREILDRAIVASPLDPIHHGCVAQVLWKLGERDAAVERVQHALRLDPGYDWAWGILRDWGTELGRPGLAVDLARDLTRRRGGETRSWLLLARCLSPQDGGDELFAALDRALALNPRCEDAFDRRAFALATLNRFDEALAQCSPAALTPAPVKLKMRAAWIEAQRGNLPKAIARAQTALAENPEFYGGWQFLSDWLLQNQQADEAVRAAEKMASLAPLEAVPLGYLADLKHRLDDRPGAKAAFQRAFALDPDYTYAGFQLFLLQLQDGELNDAEQTLNVLRRRGDNHDILACTVMIESARENTEQAVGNFTRLCDEAKASDWSLRSAADALKRRHKLKQIDAIIEQRLSAPQPPAALARLWVRRQTERGRWRLHSRLAALKAEGESGRQAILCYLDCLGEALDRAAQARDVTGPIWLRHHFRRLLKRHRDWLRQDVDGWGKVGYVLTNIGRPAAVIDWLGDWRQRPNAESWMLYNLVLMLHRKERFDEAFDVIRHAAALRHGDDLYEAFCLWAAFEEALRGNLPQAERHLATLPIEKVKEYRRPIQLMTQLLINLRSSGREERSAFMSTVRTTLHSAFKRQRPFAVERYTRTGYRRFMRVVARELDSTTLRLWGWWFYRGADWTWLPLLILLTAFSIAAPPVWILWWVVWKRFRPD